MGDFREHRKRPDLVLSAFKALSEVHPFARLTLVGKGSETCPVPADIARLVRRLGYVSHERLVELYHSCRALVLLSDFEAFGLPIAEALCTGLPVIINRQSHTADIFQGLPGVYTVENRNVGDFRYIAAKLLEARLNRRNIAHAAAERFAIHRTYGRKKERYMALLNGARKPIR